MKIKYLFTILFLSAALSFGQGWMNGGRSGNFNPDSLKPITLSGKVIADSSMMYGMYYLDINNDNKPDYILNLGPYWYKPDSSSAGRPKVGDIITITGGLFNNMMNYAPMVVVYSINGNFWRSPYDSFWDDMGRGSMMGGMNHSGMGYAFGWNNDSLQSINLEGTILIDSTFMYNYYYLDVNHDGTPDYILNFGPPWYTPSNGIKFPQNGDNVTITGWKMMSNFMNMVMVYKLNGQTWQDSTQLGNGMGGGWIHKSMSRAMKFFNPFDTTDWMQVNPNWSTGGMMGGGMMPDSFYCRILEVFPHDVPNDSNQNAMAAFEVGIFYPNGINGMMQSGGMGGRMNFNSMINFQFHFNNIQASDFNLGTGNLKVKYWDNQSSQWNEASNMIFNKANNTVSISQSQASNFYIVTADRVTGVKDNKNSIPGNFSLQQNYPNPFNPTTVISYQLPKEGIITVKIYDILGNEITTLVNGFKTAGRYSVSFDASHLASGVYFYQLQSNGYVATKKMILLK